MSDMSEYPPGRAPSATAMEQRGEGPAPGQAPVKGANGAVVQDGGARRRDSVQSVDRALALVDALARSAGSLQLTELAQQTQLNVSTGHHLLATLVKWGYVARTPGRRYALGARGLHLAHAFLKQVDLPRRAQPHMDRISEETGETVQLAVLQG